MADQAQVQELLDKLVALDPEDEQGDQDYLNDARELISDALDQAWDDGYQHGKRS